LGDADYGQMVQSLAAGQQAIVIAANGPYSFKGSGYVRGGIFDRIELIQGENGVRFRDKNHKRLGGVGATGARGFHAGGLFALPPGSAFDPAEPWRLQLLVQRPVSARDKAFLTFDVGYALPDKYVRTERRAITAAAPEPPQQQATPAAT